MMRRALGSQVPLVRHPECSVGGTEAVRDPGQAAALSRALPSKVVRVRATERQESLS